MSVDSYLELFTTLFGWTFYGILWDVLLGTGIVFLPFLGILIDNWREPAEGGEFGTVTGLSLRRMELELFIALLVVVLAGQPAALTPLNAAALNYTPPPTLIDPTPPTATVAAPQSTYGSTGFAGSPATVNIPVWWYAVLSMTSGFNHAVVEGLPSAVDMRTYEQQARLATIADPRLRQEVSDFFSQCYIPARSKYQAERPVNAAVNALLTTYGPDDPDWMGSQVYRNTSGYYDTLRANTQVSGWAYNAARDTEYDPASPPTWGKPTCKQWWEDGAIGLRQKAHQRGRCDLGRFLGTCRCGRPGPGQRATERCCRPDRPHQLTARVVEQRPGGQQQRQYGTGRHRGESRQGRPGSGWRGRCVGHVLGHDDRSAPGPADGPGAAAARHLRLAAHGRRPVAVFPVHDGGRCDGHLHREVLERALVPGHVG